ncbi:MAG: DUF2231 domain-containing protein [Gemmatimonadota bacterium]|nr:DUF2231 domain-containing protein [Gemmatimonadales bacterium]MDQ3208722.1 DUF2231 domain-containing protein [Gemmatimonadota bacterium]
MHSWHPVVVHLPLVGLVVAAAFDLVAVRRRSARWRDAATVLWWVGLLGAAAAVTTGLLAYNRVEHSDPAHVEMTLHRNLALAAVTVLLVTALWRWRRAYSQRAALLGLIGAGILGGVGYLGGDLVYRHALGIPLSRWKKSPASEGGAGRSIRKKVLARIAR